MIKFLSKKMMMVVMALFVGAQADGHWITLPFPKSVIATQGSLTDCGVDSKGTVWYTLLHGRLYPDTTKAPVNYPGIPVDISTHVYEMGLYVDQSTD